MNDIIDANSDRQHPVKCNRPLASGVVSRRSAIILASVLSAIGIAGGSIMVNRMVGVVTGAYLLMNIAYTFRLKRYSLVDITVIAIGFLLRLLAGSEAVNCHLSSWIVIVTFLLALFLGLGKRREDVDFYEETGVKIRSSVSGYSLRFIDMGMSLTGAATVAAYFIYTVIPGPDKIIKSEFFFVTGLPVTIGLLRYLQICVDTSKGGDHSVLMWKDSVILWSMVLYVLIFIILLIWN